MAFRLVSIHSGTVHLAANLSILTQLSFGSCTDTLAASDGAHHLFSYAIKGSPTGKLLLEDIYYAIESRVSSAWFMFQSRYGSLIILLVPLFPDCPSGLEGESLVNRSLAPPLNILWLPRIPSATISP